jgi:hypothetical protein
MGNERIYFVEGATVEQDFDAFAGGHFALSLVLGNAFGSAAQFRLFAQAVQLLDFFVGHRK